MGKKVGDDLHRLHREMGHRQPAADRAVVESYGDVARPIREVAYDRWGMTQLSQDLAERGATVVPFGQGYGSMSAPLKEWTRLIATQAFHHDGNPCMRWQVGNVVFRKDPAGNVKVDKDKSYEKVDGPVATVMALGRAIAHTAEPARPPARLVTF